MLLLVDNGSVFTKDISSTLSKSDVKFEQKSFDEISLDEIRKYDSFILSGRRLINPNTKVLALENERNFLIT